MFKACVIDGLVICYVTLVCALKWFGFQTFLVRVRQVSTGKIWKPANYTLTSRVCRPVKGYFPLPTWPRNETTKS